MNLVWEQKRDLFVEFLRTNGVTTTKTDKTVSNPRKHRNIYFNDGKLLISEIVFVK